MNNNMRVMTWREAVVANPALEGLREQALREGRFEEKGGPSLLWRWHNEFKPQLVAAALPGTPEYDAAYAELKTGFFQGEGT